MKDYGIKVNNIHEAVKDRFSYEQVKLYVDTRHRLYKRYCGIFRRQRDNKDPFDIPTAYDFFIEGNPTIEDWKKAIKDMDNTTIFDIRKRYRKE